MFDCNEGIPIDLMLLLGFLEIVLGLEEALEAKREGAPMNSN